MKKIINFHTISSSTRIDYFQNIITRANTCVPLGRIFKNHIPISDSKEHSLLLKSIPPDRQTAISSTKLCGLQGVIIRADISVPLVRTLKIYTTMSGSKKHDLLLQDVPPDQLHDNIAAKSTLVNTNTATGLHSLLETSLKNCRYVYSSEKKFHRYMVFYMKDLP